MTSTATTVRNGEAELHVEQHGAGPDVLLLCGLGDPLEVWRDQYEALGDRYRFTGFDNRGVGRTKAPIESISIPAMASDAAAIVRALGLERPHVMGFSGGGHIAQAMAIEHPDLVGSLVLCGTFSEMDTLTHRRTDSWLQMAAGAESPEAFLRSFLTTVYTREAHLDGRVDRWIEEMLASEHPMSDEAFVATVRALQESETTSGLHRIAVPTLVISGDADVNIGLSYSRELADRIPGAALAVMPGQGHQPFQEVPEDYNAIVNGFWERLAT
ncbi:MAG TPA: alpha/beta fold hydrolase [Solirubrobacteraceae bacterium]|jgi:pimeloyl-ACP methyl ester carboxylesterase